MTKPPTPTPTSARQNWERVRRAESQLAVRLRKISAHIQTMVANFAGTVGQDGYDHDRLTKLLDDYGRILQPWAEKEAERFLGEVAARDERAWIRNSRRMAVALRTELAQSEVGRLVQEQSVISAKLISSLPSEAAQRIRALTIKARADGTRPADLEASIMQSGAVSASRARLIARTEVARTASLLTQTRASAVGSTHYVWRTVRDGDVRKSHKSMEGIVCEWAKPPTLSDGTTTHAGQIYNCRCFPEPLFDED